MDPNTINMLIAIIGAGLALAGFFVGRTAAHKSDGREMGQLMAQNAEVLNRLGRIEKGIDRNDSEIRSINAQLGAIKVRAERAQAAADRANSRIDTIEGKV